MVLKIVLCLTLCSSLALGFSIDSRLKRQTGLEAGFNAASANDIIRGATNNQNTENNPGNLENSGRNDAGTNNRIVPNRNQRSNLPENTNNNNAESSNLLDNNGFGGPLGAFANIPSSFLKTAANTFSRFIPGIGTGNGISSLQNRQGALEDFGNRFQKAFDTTYKEEQNSVSDSWNNIKNLAHQGIETNANLTKTAIDLGTVVPKFGKNFLSNN